MKEATGELNITVIVVIIVALLSFFFFSIIWPNIRTNFRNSANCDDAICECPSRDAATNKCNYTGSTVECYFKGNPNQKITCTWKG